MPMTPHATATDVCMGIGARLNPQPRKKNQMTKLLISYIAGLVIGAGSVLVIVEHLLK